MFEESTEQPFVMRKVNDVSMGAVGGVLGTTLWQTAEASMAKGNLAAPAMKDVAKKGIYTIPVAVAVALMADLSAKQPNQGRF